MLLLVSGATKTVNKYASRPNLGRFITPNTGNRIDETLPWAADNAAFTGFDTIKFTNMLNRVRGRNPIFVTCPDVVGDACATRDLFGHWQPIISDMHLPVAYVLQNGQDEIPIPWEKTDAIFIGGDTQFKLGAEVRGYVAEAKKRGKWVHMGRVNTIQRIIYAKEIGCDSIDGTGFSMFPQTHIPWALSVLENDQMSFLDYEELTG